MPVSETRLFNGATLQLRIVNMNGAELTLRAKPNVTVDSLKLQATAHFFHSSESVKTSLYHKVLHVQSGRLLSDSKTLLQEHINNNDELLLLKRRISSPPINTGKKEDSGKDVSTECIRRATENIRSVNRSETASAQAVPTPDFQMEMRKILISLIDAAQRLLCVNPEAERLFNDMEKGLTESSSSSATETPCTPVHEHKQCVKQLQDMGFPENRARKALVLNRMCVIDAKQWLLEHESDPDIDKPLAVKQQEELQPVASSSQSVQDTKDALDLGALSHELASISGPSKVQKMLQSFRAYRCKEFKSNPQALKILTEMGFHQQQAMDSLPLHANRQEDARSCLLSEQGASAPDSSELEQGLDPDSAVFKAIMANPTIQLGLTNPRNLVAFLHMLENPSSMRQWMSDPDTAPMLILISRIYQTERNQQKT